LTRDRRLTTWAKRLTQKSRRWLVFALVGALVVAGVTIWYLRKPQMLAVTGHIASGETVKATQGSVRLPWGCKPKSWLWIVAEPNYGSGSYEIRGQTLEITPAMAGARLGLWMLPQGRCDPDEHKHFAGFWDIPVNPDNPIENLAPPKLEGDIRLGGTAVVTPGEWAPAEVDVKYVWTPDGVDFKSAVAVEGFLQNRPDISGTGTEVMLPLGEYYGVAAWAVVGYRDYPPVVMLIDSVSWSVLEVASDSIASELGARH